MDMKRLSVDDSTFGCGVSWPWVVDASVTVRLVVSVYVCMPVCLFSCGAPVACCPIKTSTSAVSEHMILLRLTLNLGMQFITTSCLNCRKWFVATNL